MYGHTNSEGFEDELMHDMTNFFDEIEWTTVWPISLYPPRNAFTGEEGPNVSVTDKPVETFLQLFPVDLIEVVAQRTSESTVDRLVDASDVKRFLATVIDQSLKPRRVDSTRGVMPREEFDWFVRNLRVGKANKDLDELSVVIKRLSETFLSCMKPSRDQYLSKVTISDTSATGEGYSFCSRSDSSGYVCQFKICGANDFDPEFVHHLTESLTGVWHHVYMDSVYNSISVVQALLKRQIYSCGPADYEPTLLEADLFKPGHFLINQSGVGVIHAVSNDGQWYLTSIHAAKTEHPDGIDIPSVIADHAKMSEVSKMRLPYPKSNVRWHGVLWHLLNVALNNSYVLHVKKFGPNLSLEAFCSNVAAGLAAEGSRPKKKKVIEPQNEHDCHLPIRGTSRRCFHCSTKTSPHRSMWSCFKCNVGLCLSAKRNCFFKFHWKK